MTITAAVQSPLFRPALGGVQASEPAPARVIARVLRVPLTAKLIGANIVLVAAAVAAELYARSIGAGARASTGILLLALVVGIVINAFLTYTALRPIRDIESTIMRMWRGDTHSRVASSTVADPELDRVGQTLNSLLDRLERDRVDMRALAGEVVRAEDREHRRISVYLHESIAQSLASVTYMLTALAAKSTEPETAERIMEIRRFVGDVLDEVDVLSHDVHPRLLNDLGLAAGLRALAFDVSRADVLASVQLYNCQDDDLKHLGPETASALYRIGQEAVQNALRHSGGSRIAITIGVSDAKLLLRVCDNGKGFLVPDGERRRPRHGIFLMKQRAELINARLLVESSPREGTCVQVTMPLGAANISS